MVRMSHSSTHTTTKKTIEKISPEKSNTEAPAKRKCQYHKHKHMWQND